MVQNDTAVFSRVRYTFRAPVNFLQRNREYVFKRPMKIGVRVHESLPYVFLKESPSTLVPDAPYGFWMSTRARVISP